MKSKEITPMVVSSKSTNVRLPMNPLAVLRTAFRVVNWVSPSAGSWLAARLFVTPRRFPRPAREQAALDSARPSHVPMEGGGFVRAWVWGEAPFVILAHGWEGRGAQLGAFVEPLRQAGFGVVTFDSPAHGDSSGRISGPPMFGDALSAVAQWVGGVYGLVAHSMGALGTRWALTRGLKVERVVFVAPGFSPDDATARMASLLELPDRVLTGMRTQVAERVGDSWTNLVREIMEGVEPPLLVFHDDHDKEVPMSAAEHWANSAQQGRLVRTSGLGHRRILRDPGVISQAVAFIGQPPACAPLDPWQRLLHGSFEIESGTSTRAE